MSLREWKNNLPIVVNAINRKLQNLSRMTVLERFFTSPRSPSIGQKIDHYYKFSVGDTVRVDLSANNRRWPFKYSLNAGRFQ